MGHVASDDGSVISADPKNPTKLRGLDIPFTQVREFHQAFGHSCPSSPTMQPVERASRRATWIDEEAQELREATTLEDQADAYENIIYFALGGMVELGVLPQGIMDIVHKANMDKLHTAEDGSTYVVKSEIGKVVKPSGWVAPEPQIAAEIERQRITRPLDEITA